MTLHVDPAAVRRAWLHGVDAGVEVTAARRRTSAASGTDLATVASVVADAAADLAGVLDVCEALVTEHGTNLEACLSTYETTDHTSAGAFDGLR
ncbi:hypothetical protein ASC77_20815 [Nocardioides sp. Root1257]|uniref:hypothetical protein n=1 Tax=unclassified Nocardioides TaxID=2615069 RepID=UPI0007017DB5|nr:MULTISPECIES: hypothetical protein [unclassified Nocardioides]KQW45216.1 hypothetical protein ASC77_20815 [Nocardioides sp. Root1257]KRC52509.1 hypothetical protein ASE24_25245 [Nocardioides sp. Root224]